MRGTSEDKLRAAAQALAQARPSMAAIGNAMAAAYEGGLESGSLAAGAENVLWQIEHSPQRIIEAAKTVLPTTTLLTYSYSGTVIEVLGDLQPKRVIVSEARPRLEGRRTAHELIEHGIAVTLITDAQLGLFVPEAGAIVVGADTIWHDGSFVNKVGTHTLALAARDVRVPFYVLSETLKVAPPSFAAKDHWREEGNPREVITEKEPRLDVRNIYFEVTPARLVRSYIAEDGVLAPARMWRYARQAELRWRALFELEKER